MITRNMPVLLASLVLACGLSACNKGKQQASIDLDEARLAVSSARNAGADIHARSTLRQAEARLDTAEKKFKKGLWTDAKKDAAVASQIASEAANEARKASARRAVKDKLGKRK